MREQVCEPIVDGLTVVKGRAVLGVDLPAARAAVIGQMRAGMRSNAALAAALPALERVVAAHFERGCC